jgi:hypothetical protein
MATLLAQALTGTTDTSLTCVPNDAKVAAEARGADGFTPRAAAVGQALTKAFGAATLTTNNGQPKPAASADGLTLSVPASTAELQRVYARWAVAQAQALTVDRVAYADQVWTRDSGKWQKADSPAAGGQVAVTVVKGA